MKCSQNKQMAPRCQLCASAEERAADDDMAQRAGSTTPHSYHYGLTATSNEQTPNGAW